MLASAPGGSPGHPVTHFEAAARELPLPVIIVPGGLRFERLEKLD